jgi:hypothetical protein
VRGVERCEAVVVEPRAERSSARFTQRAVIEFLTAEGVSPVQIHRRVQVVYGDDCVDVSTVGPTETKMANQENGFV